jgi:hypothetical protein
MRCLHRHKFVYEIPQAWRSRLLPVLPLTRLQALHMPRCRGGRLAQKLYSHVCARVKSAKATEKTRNYIAIGAKFLPALRSICLFVPEFSVLDIRSSMIVAFPFIHS